MITGASVMFRSAALRQTGLFDDGFFLYFEEVELMHRMAKAWLGTLVRSREPRHGTSGRQPVASGIQAAVRSLPAYRYEARRRYFVRTNGVAGLFAANLAWIAGKLIGFRCACCAARAIPVHHANSP